MRVVLLCSAILASVSGAVAQTNGPEALTDRSDILGWEAVGRLDTGDRGYCSGVLISPTHVLTVAHCLFDGRSQERLDPAAMTFHAGFRDGDAIASAAVARAVVRADFDPEDDDTSRYLENDLALLELRDPIPATTASPYEVASPPATGASVTALSYGHGRDNTVSRDAGCRLVAKGIGIMAFSCQGTPGASGAPIFDTTGQYPRIISLISSGGPYEGKPAVFGAMLPRAVAELERAFRTGDGVWPKTLPSARRVGGENRSAGSARFVKP